MKSSLVATMAAILLAVTGLGFGIARAAATHNEGPVLTVEDMEALERGGPSTFYVENEPVLSFEDQAAYAGGRSLPVALEPQGTIGTGRLPSGSGAEPSTEEIGNIRYRVGIDSGP